MRGCVRELFTRVINSSRLRPSTRDDKIVESNFASIVFLNVYFIMGYHISCALIGYNAILRDQVCDVYYARDHVNSNRWKAAFT